MNVELQVGNLYSSDLFYDEAGRAVKLEKLGVLAVEMEAAGLYIEAARCKKHALAICSISDNVITGEALDADSRVTRFNEMIITALDTAVAVTRNSME
jgi:purine-nucleoside phosphorylase